MVKENLGQNFLKLVIDSIDFEKLAFGIIDEVIEKALDKIVESSDNTWDNSIKALLWPILEKEAKDQLRILILNLKK